MLRRDPTTIKLTVEDLRDSALADHAVLAAALQSETHNTEGDADDQNCDSSVDESYLGSRGAGTGAGVVTGGVSTYNDLPSK